MTKKSKPNPAPVYAVIRPGAAIEIDMPGGDIYETTLIRLTADTVTAPSFKDGDTPRTVLRKDALLRMSDFEILDGVNVPTDCLIEGIREMSGREAICHTWGHLAYTMGRLQRLMVEVEDRLMAEREDDHDVRVYHKRWDEAGDALMSCRQKLSDFVLEATYNGLIIPIAPPKAH